MLWEEDGYVSRAYIADNIEAAHREMKLLWLEAMQKTLADYVAEGRLNDILSLAKDMEEVLITNLGICGATELHVIKEKMEELYGAPHIYTVDSYII